LCKQIHHTLILNLRLRYAKFFIRTNVIRAISSCPPATRMLLAT
jgi:hypothetical protein